MTDLFDVRGLYPIFYRASLDISEALLLSPDETTTITIEKRMRPYILGCLDVLRQYEIYNSSEEDVVEFQYLVEKTILDILTESEEGMALTKEEMCEAVKCGVLGVFGQALAGSPSNTGVQITFDEEGNPIITDGGLGDGAGQNIDTLLTAMGEAEYIEARLEEYLQDWEDFHTIYGGGTLSMTDAMEKKYTLLEGTANAIAVNYANYRGSNPALPTTLDGLDRKIFCLTEDFTTIASFVLDDGLAEPLLRLDMIEIIDQSMFTLWREQASGESQDYVNTNCFRYPNVELQLTDADSTVNGFDRLFNLSGFMKDNRLYKLEVTASFAHVSNGDTHDGYYRKSGNVYTYQPIRIANATNNSHVLPGVQPEVSLTGYTVLYPNNGTRRYLGVQFGSTGVDWTGSISVKIIDLGTAI